MKFMTMTFPEPTFSMFQNWGFEKLQWEGTQSGVDNICENSCYWKGVLDYDPFEEFGLGKISTTCDSTELFNANCESLIDIDEDHIAGCRDNCPDTPNPNQMDEDGDDIGDECDDCDRPNPDGSMLPCRDPFTGVDPADCDSAQLAQAQQAWDNMWGCIDGLQRPINTGLDSAEWAALRQEYRAFIRNTVQPTDDEFCWFWSHNPDYNEIINWASLEWEPRWDAAFYNTCPESHYSRPSPEIVAAFHRADRCWQYSHGVNNISSRIEYYQNILNCLPESIDWPDCMTPKVTISQLRAYYQASIDRLRADEEAANNIIDSNCN